ncbi:MAG: M48 family metallopeptidase [Myxococcales bacterium]|nr:M48 family metallopeptidase [Myxococcales bacterium]
MAPRLDLRCQSDADLEAKLLAEAEVRRAVEKLEQEPDLGARRQLLATAVRVTPAMSPRLDALVSNCREKLGIETAVEMYVYPDAAFNAGCVRPEQGRVFVLLSSALLEAFDDEELRFVVGHELGHHIFEHHRLPVWLLAGEDGAPGPLAMTLFAWSRFAEVSADRAGLVCAGGLEPVARSLFKLASGLKGGWCRCAPATCWPRWVTCARSCPARRRRKRSRAGTGSPPTPSARCGSMRRSTSWPRPSSTAEVPRATSWRRRWRT